jgi:hypothetical protein
MGLTEQLWVLAGVAYAMLLGGVIGFERELKNRPAGFRTHMLVAGAAAFLIGLGQLLMLDPHYTRRDMLTIDPLRLVEAVVAGVSFIGAGTIFAHRGGAAIAGDRGVARPSLLPDRHRRHAADADGADPAQRIRATYGGAREGQPHQG